MRENQKQLTLIECWHEIKSIEHKLDLYKTLRETNGDISACKLKPIVSSGGIHITDSMLMDLITNDKYTELINGLYKSLLAYEEYLVSEIERLKLCNPSYVIAFMRDYKKMGWKRISYDMNFSVRQCRRYYDEYSNNY